MSIEEIGILKHSKPFSPFKHRIERRTRGVGMNDRSGFDDRLHTR